MRWSRSLAFDACHRPPRRVRMPRAFSSAATWRRLSEPVALIVSTIGASSRAKASALSVTALRRGAVPFPALLSAAAPFGLPRLRPARLRGLQSLPGAPSDGLALLLGDECHDPAGEVVRLRHVGREEPDAAVAQREQERRVARELVELGGSARRCWRRRQRRRRSVLILRHIGAAQNRNREIVLRTGLDHTVESDAPLPDGRAKSAVLVRRSQYRKARRRRTLYVSGRLLQSFLSGSVGQYQKPTTSYTAAVLPTCIPGRMSRLGPPNCCRSQQAALLRTGQGRRTSASRCSCQEPTPAKRIMAVLPAEMSCLIP